MANIQNLKPMNKRTKDEQREIAQKAGKKSGEARRAKKQLREVLEMALEMSDNTTGEINAVAITQALINAARKGNVRAYEVIRDTIGEKPTDKQEFNFTPVTIIDDI